MGEEAEFLCRATTDPSLTSSLAITWLRDGEELQVREGEEREEREEREVREC